MYFTFDCPECHKQLKVQVEAAGHKARCPYCKHSLVVPDAPQSKGPPRLPETFPGITDVPKKSYAERTPRSAPKRLPEAARESTPKATGGGWSERTDVSLLHSGLIGMGVAAAILVVMFPLAKMDINLGQLFLERGNVPFALVFLFGWAMAILVLKWRKIKRQKDSMLFDLLPSNLSADIRQDSVDKFVEHIQDLPLGAGESFLVNRVLRGLEHFHARNSNPEVASILSSQSDIDANAVQSSYTILNVLIWALPILGFIGTVIGISSAVSSIDTSGDIEQLKESLNLVTGGLALAFDTTLIALVMSMIVMFPTSSLQKAEEDMLNSVDEYCNENLLKRLNDGREIGGDVEAPADLRAAINAAMAPHHAELTAWNQKLDSIGGQLTNQVVQGWGAINKEMLRQQQENVGQIQDIDAMVVTLQKMLVQLTRQTESVHQRAAGAMTQSAQSLQGYVSALQQGLAGLNQVLADLGEKQVTIEAPTRRGWFSRKK